MSVNKGIPLVRNPASPGNKSGLKRYFGYQPVTAVLQHGCRLMHFTLQNAYKAGQTGTNWPLPLYYPPSSPSRSAYLNCIQTQNEPVRR